MESEIIAVEAPNRQALIDRAWAEIKVAYPDGNYPNPGVFLSIRLEPCGSVDYKTPDDIPFESVPCLCGNPKHWFIKYTGSKGGGATKKK